MRKLNLVRKYLKKREMINFYKKFISAGDLCYDIGANIGERTEVFLKLGAKVVSVEPQYSCSKILKQKFANNDNVKLINCAIGSEVKEDELMICEETDECSTLSKDFISAYSESSGFNWRRSEIVKVITLENLFEHYRLPKFCKIDVEGYESEVFRGMKHKIKYIAFEFNKPLLNDTAKSLEILSRLGNYKCNFIKYEFMNLVLDEWLSAEDFKNNLRQIINPDILTGEIVIEFL